jgi:DNA-binding CsgD family transcriptional regulator/tetratricopeptide (TPR) repeat protein
MLLGRERERQALERLLAGARSGMSAALAIVGEPGIGKSALLEEARASAHGFTVLHARGIESEAKVPFGGLLELLRPALGLLGSIPKPQADALGRALALRPGPTGEQFAVGAATLSLLAAEAEEQPVLVLLDDAQWLDVSSGAALLFAIRRLVADPIAVLVTERAGEPSVFDGAGLEALELRGLDRAEAAEVVERVVGRPLDDDTLERLYVSTAGNPLGLVQLAPVASELTDPTRAGPVPVSTSVGRAFAARAGRLTEPQRAVLVVAAASEVEELAIVGRAASMLALDVTDLEAAEDAGLVQLDAGRIVFAHPLARSAIYAEASAQQRRAAHRALADALPDRDRDRRAWHLAAATLGPDERAAEALAGAGVRARERAAHAVAAAAFERGARLHPEVGRRAALLFDAAESAWLTGSVDECRRLVDEAEPLALDPLLAARIAHRRGRLLAGGGRADEAHDLIAAAAGSIAATRPALAIAMLADAVDSSFPSGDSARMLAAAERAVELSTAQADPRSSFFAVVARGMALVFAGRGAEGADSFREAVAIAETHAGLRDDPETAILLAMGPLYLREAHAGNELIDRALEVTRAHAAIGALPRLLHRVARGEAGDDRWATAQAHYTESLALARETRQQIEVAGALSGLARLQARLGHEEQCRVTAAESLVLCSALGATTYEIWTHSALGELELGLGNAAAAAVHFERQAARLVETGLADVDLSPEPELVECHLRLGGDPVQPAGRYLAAATAKGQPWALARAERSLALVAAEGDAEPHFRRALELHAATPDVFEAARTRLAFGAYLRRARQRTRARPELRAAIEVFDELGAEPWAALAGAELAATGETARRRSPHTLGDLTPQELQIALILAGGKTTREAAAALFLSPKTVEYHLRHVYRKLDIRSREALAAAMRRR